MSYFNKRPVPRTNDGKVTYGSGLLTNIITYAVEEIDDVALFHSSNPIKYIFDKDGVAVDVDIKINYTCNVSEMAFKVQESIRHNVEAMTEYKINTVNVNVKDVFFDDAQSK